MKLTIQNTQQNISGGWRIDVLINNRPYKYELTSQHSYELMIAHYHAGRHANCLAVLNKHNEAK